MMQTSSTLLLRSVVLVLTISRALACRCVSGSTELQNSLQPSDAIAASLAVGNEITPQPRDDINAPRFWEARIIDVFKGCELGASGTNIVIRTGGNSALCGSELTDTTKYLLIGQKSIETVDELNYKGPVLSINSCTFQKPLAELTKQELNILGKPKCEPPKINCATCPQGFFDGCNSCFCNADGLAGCSKKFCLPGTETQAVCNCVETDTKTCPDGTIVERNRLNSCEFDPCPDPPPKCCDPYEKPGFGTNPPGCKEGFQCCPDGQWSCSIGDGKSFPCGGVIITEGFGEQCDVPIVCTDDVFQCPDGTFVSRDPMNDCKFEECNAVFCTADVRSCPDGSFVSRNPNLGCAFDPCPLLDCKTCPFGFFDGCNTCGCAKGGATFCTLRACGPNDLAPPKCNPKPDIVCTADAKLCIDGSSVGRDPTNNCNFFPCPPPSCKICPFGYNDGCNDCQCDDNGTETCTERACLVQGEPECFPEPIGCPEDVFECPDGTFVSRDPKNGCKFEQCPIPKGCSKLDSCFLVDLTKTPTSETKLKGGDKYGLLTGKSGYSVYCTLTGKADQVTFYYPNGEKDRHVESTAPWYMRGDTAGRINRVPYLNKGCGKKKFTVEGKVKKNVCFSVTIELEAVC